MKKLLVLMLLVSVSTVCYGKGKKPEVKQSSGPAVAQTPPVAPAPEQSNRVPIMDMQGNVLGTWNPSTGEFAGDLSKSFNMLVITIGQQQNELNQYRNGMDKETIRKLEANIKTLEGVIKNYEGQVETYKNMIKKYEADIEALKKQPSTK